MKLKKIIYTRNFPWKGFDAITILLWCFVREDCRERFDERSERHENIHLAQELELLFVLFYILYGLEWIIRLVVYRDRMSAYINISFEQEAYRNQYDPRYLDNRRHFAWLKYMFNKNKKV